MGQGVVRDDWLRPCLRTVGQRAGATARWVLGAVTATVPGMRYLIALAVVVGVAAIIRMGDQEELTYTDADHQRWARYEP